LSAQLVIVYNAKAGLLAGAFDSIHKLVSPDTYECDLCALTHGLVSMRPEWRLWLKQLPMPTVIYHKPDFRVTFPQMSNQPLPLVGLLDDGQLNILLDAKAIRSIADADQLVTALRNALPPR
jgi:hypothetical protein